MNRIKELWESFACAVIPPDASETQYKEMRRAFYAGACACFGTVTMIDDSMPDNESARMLTELDDELRQFSEDIKRGKV